MSKNYLVNMNKSILLLKKYKFGAESIKGIQVTLETGVNLEIGDIVVVDFASLQLSDIQSGSRSGDARLMQIDNWELDFATGAVSISVTDTLFDKDQRTSLVSPCSRIKSGVSTNQFIIEQVNPISRFGPAEYRKWDEFLNRTVTVRSPDFSVAAEVKLTIIEGNKITVEDLGFVPAAGYLLEVGPYSTQDSSITIKYGFLSDGGDFPDGKPQYTLF